MDQTNDHIRVPDELPDEIPDEGRSFGQILTFFAIAVLVVIVVILPPILLFSLGTSDESYLERLRDTAIVLMGAVWIIILILLSVIVFVMVWVAFQIKNRALPLLEEILAAVKDTSEEATETVKRARGTAEFVSERIATPVISTVSTAAKWRATARMFISGKDKKRK